MLSLLKEIGFSDKNKAGKRRKMGIFACGCGVEVVQPLSTVKNGHVRFCEKCGRVEAGRNSRKDPSQVVASRVYLRTKSNAKIRGIKFSLTREEAYRLILNTCAYCGQYSPGGTLHWDGVTQERAEELQVPYCGIDRIDSGGGYTKENSVSCCKRCNLAKHEMTKEEYINHCLAVIQFHEAQFLGAPNRLITRAIKEVP